jgi:DNA-directed RNA polymerase beta subunit
MTAQYIQTRNMDNKDNKDNQDNMVTSDDIHTLIQLYFKQPNILYNHQYNSFNQLIDEYIPYILKKEDNVFFSKVTSTHIYNYRFIFEDICLKPPTIENENEILFPSTARLMNLTYSAKLMANITQIQEKINITTKVKETKIIGEKENEYHVANIPIMLRSKYCNLNDKKNKNMDTKECKYDPGAYFIVKGSEKLVISLERMIENKACTYINIKLAKSGGIKEALDINKVAEAAGIPCMMGGMLESRLALSAKVHLAMSLDNIQFYDLDTCLLGHKIDPVTGGAIYKGMHLELSDAPGIGADVDPAFLQTLEQVVI